MPEIFITAFGSTFGSMLKIFFIILIAGVLIRKNVLSQENLQGLAVATVDVFLPCMIFSKMLTALKPGEFDIWWVLPLTAAAMIVVGLGVGALSFFRQLPERLNMLPLISIQNSGYLVLPIGAVLFPDQFDLFSLYVFLFILGQTPFVWSIGKYMLTAVPDTRLEWKGLVTPPLAATVLALALVFTGLRDVLFSPDETSLLSASVVGLLEAVRLLGDATVPLALFVLGGVLGSISFRLQPYRWDAVRVMAVKLFIIPVITLAVVHRAGLGESYPLLAVFFVIQSAAPPAAVLILQIKKYGGDEQKIGSILLVSYLVCLITLPLWVAVWKWISASPG
jgi:predicted permease